MDPAKDLILAKILEDLKDAKSEQSINDLDAKFQLYFPVEAVMSIGQYKRPKQHSYYTICCRSRLGNLTKQFVLTPEQLCENLQAKQKVG
jgi:transcription elongation factor SPT6